ncbi:MAG: Na/Pi symporter [Faecalibacterium prausnitzii]
MRHGSPASFTRFSNPLLGVLVGALVTGIIQSSSASVGILQALSATGVITYGSAIPIIMGQNIGTCVTALLSSVGANKNARRAAMVHLYFNIIGVDHLSGRVLRTATPWPLCLL